MVYQVIEWVIEILLVCTIAFLLVWYLGRRVSNVGDSMNPTMQNGDIVLVNTLVYDATNPKRGDIVVFKPQGDEHSHSYMKRVVGLPGEEVEIKKGSIYINGEKLNEKYSQTDIEEAGLAKEPIKLKEREYFVIGDNSGSSEDSRFESVGNVNKAYIEGKAWFIISPKKNAGFLK